MSGEPGLRRRCVFLIPVVVATVLFGILSLFAWRVYQTQRASVAAGIRTQLESASTSAALMVDGDKVGALTPADRVGSPAYQAALEGLTRFHESKPQLRYVYTMRMWNGRPVFVLDTAPMKDTDRDGIVDKSLPFEPYLSPNREMLEALQTQTPRLAERPYADKWGTFVSAYAPIFDSQARFVGIVGVDLAYTDYLKTLGRTEREYQASLGLAALGSSVFGLFVWGLVRRIAGLVTRVREEQDEIEAINSELTAQIRTDHLTRIGNRFALEEWFERRVGTVVSVLFIDLENFKVINDLYGHATGDALLQGVARRLSETVECCAVFRFGGDEFVLVSEAGWTIEEARERAIAVAGRVSDELSSDGMVFWLNCSVGVAAGEIRPDKGSHLLRRAEAAANRALEPGGQRVAVFDDEAEARMIRRRTLEAQLPQAITKQELWVAWQPIVDLDSGRVTGAEGLMRWTRADGSTVSPGEFIPIAEDIGVIDDLGRMVFETACRKLSEWKDDPVLGGLRLSVNVSVRQFRAEDFVPWVQNVIAHYEVPPGRIVMEITESAYMESPGEVVPLVEELKRAGVVIAIDDFGTGYSSLQMLMELPFDIVKLDRSFVQRMTDDPKCFELTRTLMAMSISLGMQTVAEGIETEGQAELLASLTCTYGQGFLFARPMAEEQFVAFCREDGRAAA